MCLALNISPFLYDVEGIGRCKIPSKPLENPHFEYAFSYFRQMARDAVDGRTINVVL